MFALYTMELLSIKTLCNWVEWKIEKIIFMIIQSGMMASVFNPNTQ